MNEHGFEIMQQARTEIAAWRRDYNEVRFTATSDGYHRLASPSGIAGMLSMPLGK